MPRGAPKVPYKPKAKHRNKDEDSDEEVKEPTKKFITNEFLGELNEKKQKELLHKQGTQQITSRVFILL